MQIPFVDLKAQYAALGPEIDQAMNRVMDRMDFILGQDVDLFEQEFATYCDADFAVGIDSGTSALELILRAYGIGQGDEAITVANTFIATVLAISYVGATPVLVDADPNTYTIDVAKIEAAITPKTKAIMPVHLYGQPADMDPIMALAEKHNLVVVEDACQAHGARYKGRRCGSLGHAAAFSFYPGKNLGAYGDGGAVVTSDPKIIEDIKMLRHYGQKEKYNHLLRGFNRRLDTLQAAILRVKLQHLEEANQARRHNAQLFNQRLADSGLTLPQEASYAESVYHLFVVRTEDREGLSNDLRSKGIATGIHYPIPIHILPAYEDLGYKKGDFPVSEQYASEILSLPMYPELTAEMIHYVADAIKESLSHVQVAPVNAVPSMAA